MYMDGQEKRLELILVRRAHENMGSYSILRYATTKRVTLGFDWKPYRLPI